MKRRKFLQSAGAAMTIPVMLNGMKLSAMPKSSVFGSMNETDRVLILIRLNGGNDGLNMVIPRDQYDGIAAVRNNIMIPENNVLPLSDTVGLHPIMTGAQNLFNDGRLAVMQAVGYPNQNRSHFRSTDIWTSGSPANEYWNTGWMGRYFQGLHPDFPEGYPNEEFAAPFAITMGRTVSETCQGTSSNFSLTLSDPFNIAPLTEGEPGLIPDTPYGEELAFLRVAITQSNAYGDTITEAANLGTNMVDYPEDNELAQQLKNAALLIGGGLQTKVYIVSLGGFDTHANQVALDDTTVGGHANLLKTLSDAMAAFQADLVAQGLDERVMSLTFSEFGRRIKSNESLGTDHGTAAPLFLFGSCVNPSIFGDNPEIPADIGNSEGVPMQHDFRDIYGSVLMDWFGVSETDVNDLLYQDFTYLPVIQGCEVNSVGPNLTTGLELALNCYPNPCRNNLTVEFNTLDEWARLSIFDSIGSEVKTVFNKRLQPGVHKVNVDMHDLPAGGYYCRLQLGSRHKTKRVIKI
jgi:uncharacterized protein (DUF1501 family)